MGNKQSFSFVLEIVSCNPVYAREFHREKMVFACTFWKSDAFMDEQEVLYSQVDRAKCPCIFAKRDTLCPVPVNAMQQAEIVKNKQAAPRQVCKAIQKVSVGW